MKRLNSEVIQFFHNQGCVVVASVDRNGFPHSACKGIIKITPSGSIYLLDLYKGATYENLKRNPHLSVTAIDEHKFAGYCLKGRARILPPESLHSRIIKSWEDRITGRITRRLLKNIREEKGHSRHPEVLLPKPEYMIVVTVEEIVDLTPHHITEP